MTNKQAKAWLQDRIKNYGINLENWVVKLVSQPRPHNYPGHYPHSGQMIYAVNPEDDMVEICVDNIWVSDDGTEILQDDGVRLG